MMTVMPSVMASVVTPVVTPVMTPVVTSVVTSAEAAGQGLGGGEGKGESQQEKQGEEPHLQQTRKQSGRGDEAEGRVASRAAVREEGGGGGRAAPLGECSELRLQLYLALECKSSVTATTHLVAVWERMLFVGRGIV